MALLSGRAPRVYLEYGDGNYVEMKVQHVESRLDHGKIGMTTITVHGDVLDSDVVKAGPMLPTPTYVFAGKAGEPRIVGGIPEECVLTCSGCGHVDEETHVCSV